MGSLVSIRNSLPKKVAMKFVTSVAVAALANGQLTMNSGRDEEDKKFSDKPDWIAGDAWESYHNQGPNVRLEQVKCRVEQYMDQWFVEDSSARDIERTYKHCGDNTEYQPTGYECNWKDWLGVSFEKDTDLFMRCRAAANETSHRGAL